METAGDNPKLYIPQLKHMFLPPDIFPISIVTVFTLSLYGMDKCQPFGGIEG